MPDLLFEIGVEELPASYLDAAIDQLKANVQRELEAARLPFGAITVTGTPRRLVVHVASLPEMQSGESIEEWGPPESSAFKDGKPTKAAEGFAARVKQPIAAIKIEEKPEDKGGKKGVKYLLSVRQVEGAAVATLLATTILPNLIRSIVFPKSMTWVPGSKLRFARPVRRLVALFGKDVVAFEWNGVRSARTTIGHAFLAPAAFELADASFEAYSSALRERRVVVGRDERRKMIEAAVRAQSPFQPNAAVVATVANLVEWPEVMTGAFEPGFLEIPHAVIVSAIETHLRAFPIFESAGRVTNRFAFIANRPPDAVIREGNERVVNARLSDARHFYKEDQKTPLKDLAKKLKDVVFQDKLGSFDDKQTRVAKIADELAGLADWNDARANVERAASIMKADLQTQVVFEFPELQGEVGAVYAKKQGEPDDVAAAIREAYLPKHEGDALPVTRTGILLSLAEKLDNAACAFAVNMQPTGSKDPLGIRRQVIGTIRILREKRLPLPLGRLYAWAVERLPDALFEKKKKNDPKAPPPPTPEELRAALVAKLVDYAKARLMAIAHEEGRRHDLVQAALAVGFEDVPDFFARLDALSELAKDAEFAKLTELVERTKNITKKETQIPARADAALLRDENERALHDALESARGEIGALLERRDYVRAGRRYQEALARPVASFFEHVFVMDEDTRVRANRLALLRDVHGLLAGRFADLAEGR